MPTRDDDGLMDRFSIAVRIVLSGISAIAAASRREKPFLITLTPLNKDTTIGCVFKEAQYTLRNAPIFGRTFRGRTGLVLCNLRREWQSRPRNVRLRLGIGRRTSMELGPSVGTAKKRDSLQTPSGSLKAFLEGHPHKPSKHPLRIKPSSAIRFSNHHRIVFHHETPVNHSLPNSAAKRE